MAPFLKPGTMYRCPGIRQMVAMLSGETPEERAQYNIVVTQDADPSVGNDSFRLVIVNQKKSWEKAVRVYPTGDDWFEVKCGDASGKFVRTNPEIKFDDRIVPLGNKDLALRLMRPKIWGIWEEITPYWIPMTDFDKYRGQTIYVFMDNDGDKYFHNLEHRMAYSDMV